MGFADGVMRTREGRTAGKCPTESEIKLGQDPCVFFSSDLKEEVIESCKRAATACRLVIFTTEPGSNRLPYFMKLIAPPWEAFYDVWELGQL